MKEQGRRKKWHRIPKVAGSMVLRRGKGSEGQLRCKCAGQRWKLL